MTDAKNANWHGGGEKWPYRDFPADREPGFTNYCDSLEKELIALSEMDDDEKIKQNYKLDTIEIGGRRIEVVRMTENSKEIFRKKYVLGKLDFCIDREGVVYHLIRHEDRYVVDSRLKIKIVIDKIFQVLQNN